MHLPHNFFPPFLRVPLLHTCCCFVTNPFCFYQIKKFKVSWISLVINLFINFRNFFSLIHIKREGRDASFSLNYKSKERKGGEMHPNLLFSSWSSKKKNHLFIFILEEMHVIHDLSCKRKIKKISYKRKVYTSRNNQ